MRRISLGLAPFLMPCGALLAQTHKIARPETVVRAVAVYEWVGEEGKPTASRIVPVSLYIDSQLQDAGIYLARPVPFAIDRGLVYETEKAGRPEGTVEIAYDRHVTTSANAPADAELDDGWLAYGNLKLKPKETEVSGKRSGPLSPVVASGGSKPHFAEKPDAGTKGNGEDKPDKPDADRPSFHKRPDTTTPDAKPVADTADADDPVERPTLKRRSQAETRADQKKKDTAKVLGGTDLNDDPDRPNLHRGKPATATDEDQIPPLKGLPNDMHQMVAVSDARDRPEHEFARPFESDAERVNLLGKMEAFAREQLALYKGVLPGGAGMAAPAPLETNPHGTAASRAKRRVPPAAVAAPAPLQNEVFNSYTLSYGGAATFYYAATSPGASGSTRYVTLVAQDEPVTGLKVALTSVTDSTHLDRTPQIRLVDVVDADASNRASLLLELRGQRTRQFALYRVIGAKADQIFATGTTE